MHIRIRWHAPHASRYLSANNVRCNKEHMLNGAEWQRRPYLEGCPCSLLKRRHDKALRKEEPKLYKALTIKAFRRVNKLVVRLLAS